MHNGSGTRSAFNEQLTDLRDSVLELGTFVENMLVRAMKSLLEQDAELAGEVRRSDNVADALDAGTEKTALKLLALQQPLASDLRVITGILRIIAEFERIGDYSKDIAKIAAEMSGESYFKPLEQISAMGALVIEMTRTATKCFANLDLDAAHQVAQVDLQVDALWKQLRVELMGYAEHDPSKVRQSIHLLLVARYLERAGDHAVNIAERVNYILTNRIEHLI